MNLANNNLKTLSGYVLMQGGKGKISTRLEAALILQGHNSPVQSDLEELYSPRENWLDQFPSTRTISKGILKDLCCYPMSDAKHLFAFIHSFHWLGM